MEVTWKMHWISLFLLFGVATCLTPGGSEKVNDKISTPETTTTHVTTNGPESRNDDDATYKEKSDGDLDLETQDQVAILKQINRVNDDGSYTFGYEAADGSFKIETRDVNGNVKGMFGFINEDGELKRVSYSASNGTGFQSTGTLNIPPLPGTRLSADDEGNQGYARVRYDRILPLHTKPSSDTATKINLLQSTTPVYESVQDVRELPTARLPVFIYGSPLPANEETSSSRPVVIQHIPKVRPTPASSATLPTESEEILLKPLLSDLTPKRTSNTNFISFGANDISSSSHETTTTTTTTAASTVTATSTTGEPARNPSVIQVIRPRNGLFKKVIVTKRPVVTTTPKVVTTTEYKSKQYLEKLKSKTSEAGNAVRRQLGINNNYATSTTANLVTSGTEDSPDVYGGRHVSRPYPTNAYRALFSQIPQHQRILQNSYIQNRNQYLAAALGNSGVPSTTASPQIVSTTSGPSSPGPVRTYTGTPTTPNDFSSQSSYVPTPATQQLPDQRPISLPPPNYLRQFPQSTPAGPAYQPVPVSDQIYIPPALLEHLIRMLLVAQQRLISQRQQTISPFQQAVVATLGPGNVPPELLGNRYDPRYYQPQTAYQYAEPTPSREPYETRYPIPYYPPGYAPFDPRFSYQPQMYNVPSYVRYQPRAPHPFDVDPSSQQQHQDDYVLRMLLGYQRFHPQNPVSGIQSASNLVERSPDYGSGKDSTSSSTTPTPRVGQVRNVQILGQINEESQTSRTISNRESSTKPGE